MPHPVSTPPGAALLIVNGVPPATRAETSGDEQVKQLMEMFRNSTKGKQFEATLGRTPRFVFDGDALKDDATPGALEMEDGDVIDVQ